MTKDPRFSESSVDFDPTNLSPEAQQAYNASLVARALYDEGEQEKQTISDIESVEKPDQLRAAYKIEVMFGPKRTPQGPNVLVIQAFESGKHFHGGGDELMYWCQDVEERQGCWGPIPGSKITGPFAYCPHCERMLNAERLTGQRYMNVTTQTLSEHVERVWRQLNCNADIYCKYNQDDIRYKACMEDLGPEKGHRLRGLFIYPLKNILKDTSTGASVSKRFRAFLSA